MSSIRPTATLAGFAMAATLALTGCGTSTSSPSADDKADAPAATETHYADVDGPLEDASLAEITREADVVALGRVVAREDKVQVDKSGATYSVLTVETITAINGEQKSTFDVAVMTNTTDGSPIFFEGRPDLRVGDEALWFVDTFEPDVASPRYVLSNSASVLAFDDSGALTNRNHHMPLLAAAEDLGTRDAILDAVMNAAK